MAAPYQWNAFLIPTLTDMGIACVLFDTPLAGERSLARTFNGDILSELFPLSKQRAALNASLVHRLMNVVARDLRTVLYIAREKHGLRNRRVALFGVSLGTLLSSFAFMRDGIGERLLGTLGHADLTRFAKSYTPRFARLLVFPPGLFLGRLATLCLGRRARAGIDFLAALCELASGRTHTDANPMTFAERVSGERRVRFLAGIDDNLVKPDEAIACARQFPNGECFTVPGLGHGVSRFGPSFVEHVRTFVGTQLADWRW
jgi:pimeloyl-ACP methyl ester carboxylesterase